ncbi:pilus assembly protein FimV, partial [Massilia arenosa]
DLDAFDLDLPGSAPAGSPAAAAASAPLPEPAGFDLSAIDLDLPATAADDATALPEVGELSPAHMEMETKLDLAIAYQEIGDKEGARELIEEVIKGGSPEQVAKANSMRAQLV